MRHRRLKGWKENYVYHCLYFSYLFETVYFNATRDLGWRGVETRDK